VIETLKPIVKRAFDDLFRQRALKRIDVAFDGGKEDTLPEVNDAKIETTEEERQAFMIVRAIAAEVVPVSRIAIRDGQSYCAILFDDNNRKPIIRLHFNGRQKFVTVFGADKEGVRHDVAGVEDIFGLRAAIKGVVQGYA
jgi:predicted type IV restriction endonuclease